MNRVKLSLFAGTAALIAIGIAVAHPGHPPIFPPTVTFASQAETVPFELFRGNRIVVPVTVNGHPTEAILDTAASMTTFDRAFAKSIDLPPGMKITAKGTGGDVDAELVSGV